MTGVLDIAPLRSFVAVADCGGFGRAAMTLHLSQGAVSQHVRRLESVIGRPLVVREGRGSRFTDDGEALLGEARRILAIHDETLRRFDADIAPTLVIGSTEHAADQLLPAATRVLVSAFPEHQVRFRIDRGAQLRAALDAGTIDLALLLATAADEQSRDVGELDLTWYSAPAWSPPDDAPTPLVAFDEPCALRRRAVETLAAQHIAADVVCDAANLAGVKSAVRAGLGFGLMATFGHHPTGLVPRHDLPAPAALPLSISARRGLKAEILDLAGNSVRDLLRSLSTEPAFSTDVGA